MKQNLATEDPEIITKFVCLICDYKCSKKSLYDRHVVTQKHKKRESETTETKLETKMVPKIFACKCERQFNSRTTLWRHRKQCEKSEYSEHCEKTLNAEKTEKITLDEEKIDFQKLLLETLKQNHELQKQLIEISKEKKTYNIQNTTHNSFNLNFFLNEKCKDALNIMDFVSSLQLQLQDLEETGRLGYVQGISRIFINGLKQLDVYKRPIHCSDVKRETLYVKDNNTWEKEDSDKKKITRAIRHVSIRNAKQITEWTKGHKGYNDSMHKNSDKYLKLVSEANGGEPEELNKIIKNISTNVIINKDEV